MLTLPSMGRRQEAAGRFACTWKLTPGQLAIGQRLVLCILRLESKRRLAQYRREGQIYRVLDPMQFFMFGTGIILNPQVRSDYGSAEACRRMGACLNGDPVSGC